MLAKCADHPNIVTLHEVMEDAHYVYIFMEECEGARSAAHSSGSAGCVLERLVCMAAPPVWMAGVKHFLQLCDFVTHCSNWFRGATRFTIAAINVSEILHVVFWVGGELFDLIVERGHLSERDAAVNARAILEVIRHCHSK